MSAGSLSGAVSLTFPEQELLLEEMDFKKTGKLAEL